ncbi:hypothetical protein ACET3Z_029496 [Daucus carota]
MPTPHGVKKLIQFKLYDGRQTIHVRLYDNHVACIDEVAHGNFQSFPIVVLASVRATIFGGQVEVSTLQSSRVYINPQYAAVVRIMHRTMFNSLRSLELSRTDWKIKTRVTRMWASFATNFDFIGMNMILLDTEDFHVHAFVISEAWDSLDISVFEGSTYIIENFITRRARGYLRPVTSNIDIILNESSRVTPVPLELGRIPRHKFEITELGDIYSIVSNLAPGEDSTYALDIVGVILDLGDVKVDVSDSETRVYVRFNLYDGRSEMEMFDSLDNLDSSKYEWNIKVRVIRVWDSYSTRGKKEFKGRNMLLLDDKHNRMHAFIWPNYFEEFKNSLQEGKIYAIRNFAVKNYRKESLRCTKSDKQIWFSNYTKVTPALIDERSEKMIRQNEFDFFDLGETGELLAQEDNNHLIDIIGVLKDRDTLRRKMVENDVEQRSFRFTITDGSSSLKLCFWDDMAVSFDSALRNEIETPIIIIVASCRLNLYQGEPYASNVAATRFFINYDHRIVSQMKQRAISKGFGSEQVAGLEMDDNKILTVENIRKLGVGCIQKKVRFQVIVKNVKDNLDWSYNVCTSCQKEVEEKDSKFRCEQCKRTVPFPDLRFRLCLIVEDKTGGAAVILDDREVGKIIGKTVYDVLAEQTGADSNNNFPNILKTFEGNQYTVTVLLNEDNINNGSDTFMAVDIYEGLELTEDSAPDDDHSAGGFKITQSSVQDSTTQTMLDKVIDTPDTEKSTNTNKLKRMSDEAITIITDLGDDDDDFGDVKDAAGKKKIALKHVKLEKL